jgi:hypothetical protein
VVFEAGYPQEGGEMTDVIFEQGSDEIRILVSGERAAYIYLDEDGGEVRCQFEVAYDSYLTADELLEIANKMKEMELGEAAK